MKFISIQPGDGNIFDKVITERPSFVKFYHPMCAHCNYMQEAWNKLKTNHKLLSKDINIIEVHSGENSNIKSSVARIAENQGVPFILMVNKNGKPGEKYSGDRSEDSMTEFILRNVKKHTKNVKKHTKNVKKHTKNVKKHTKNVKKYTKNVKKHTKNVKR